jgi:uncharacterized protein YutE (UPF0331/DUF86 family)
MNKTRIKQKIKEIEESLNLIEDNMVENENQFFNLGIIKDGIYKRLEFSIQNLIDIFSIIYSNLDLGVPSSVDDIFDGLLNHKIFSKKVILIVKEMKGLRNILTHRYGKIDDKKIFFLINTKKEDFNIIFKEIEEFLLSKN